MNLQMANHIYDEMRTDDSSSISNQLFEIIVAVIVTGVLVWSGYYLFNPGTFPIRQVRIEGEFKHLSTSSLQNLVRNEVRGGFFNIDVTAVRQALIAEPWVKDVSVHRIWPDSLQVFVTEQVAVAQWNNNGLLNRSGTLFEPEKSSFPENLPVLKGPEGTQEYMMSKYADLLEKLESLGLQVFVLELDNRRAWSFQTYNNIRVVLGRENFDERVTRFVDLVTESLGGKFNEIDVIDMRYPNGFAVRWKQATGVEVIEGTGAL